MNIVGTRLHGVLDYFIAVFLILCPWIFGFANSGPAQKVPVIIGGSMLVYSVFTNYEVGIIKMLSMRLHLALDFIAGLSILISPLIFKFSNEVVYPHVLTGLFITTLSLITSTPVRNRREWMMQNFKRQLLK